MVTTQECLIKEPRLGALSYRCPQSYQCLDTWRAVTRSMLPADWSRRSDYFQRHVITSDESIDLYRPRLQRVSFHCMNCRGKLVSEERAPFLNGKPRLGFTPRLKAGCANHIGHGALESSFLSQLGALSMSKSRYVAWVYPARGHTIHPGAFIRCKRLPCGLVTDRHDRYQDVASRAGARAQRHMGVQADRLGQLDASQDCSYQCAP